MKTRSSKEGELENRLLICDGHLLHIWYGTLELARAQKVTIIKLSHHTKDLLQSLDPLKITGKIFFFLFFPFLSFTNILHSLLY